MFLTKTHCVSLECVFFFHKRFASLILRCLHSCLQARSLRLHCLGQLGFSGTLPPPTVHQWNSAKPLVWIASPCFAAHAHSCTRNKTPVRTLLNSATRGQKLHGAPLTWKCGKAESISVKGTVAVFQFHPTIHEGHYCPTRQCGTETRDLLADGKYLC